MENIGHFELPESLKDDLKNGKKLEWITISYIISVIVVMFLVMGSSQAMKTAWLEDALSILPSISFLIAYKYYNKQPTLRFPYGFHRVFGIANLAGSLALFLMGGYLIIDSSISLIEIEKPSIGSMFIFGHQVWMGWIMIFALLYSALPAMILGHKKLPLALKLHNKILYTDANAQKADWTTAFAAIMGIIGIGFGFWWADATAAIFISFSVLKDGVSSLKDAIFDLMDRSPVTVKGEKEELITDIKCYVQNQTGLTQVGVRFREYGQVYLGEIILINVNNKDLNFESLREKVLNYHWKIYDVTFMEVDEIPNYFIQ